MKKKTLILAAALALLAVPALANHCPADMAAIDAALAKNPQLTAEQAAEVKQARIAGEALHKAGKHADSMDQLAKAKEILGIK